MCEFELFTGCRILRPALSGLADARGVTGAVYTFSPQQFPSITRLPSAALDYQPRLDDRNRRDICRF